MYTKKPLPATYHTHSSSVSVPFQAATCSFDRNGKRATIEISSPQIGSRRHQVKKKKKKKRHATNQVMHKSKSSHRMCPAEPENMKRLSG